LEISFFVMYIEFGGVGLAWEVGMGKEPETGESG
jgi:hypothetical protein